MRLFYEAATKKLIQRFPFEDTTLKAFGFLHPTNKDNVCAENVLALGQRLNVSLDCRKLEEEFIDYQLSSGEELPEYEEGGSLSDFWRTMGKKVRTNNVLRFPNLYQVAVAAQTIPHSNADTERLFSILRKIHTDSRSQLGDEAIHALLSTKVNNHVTCLHYEPSNTVLSDAKQACVKYNEQLRTNSTAAAILVDEPSKLDSVGLSC